MGDAGSNLLGLLLACIAIQGVLKTAAVVALFFPLVILAVPILDTGFVVAKRIKYRRPVYSPDNWHFHHRFRNIGFSQRRTVIYLYAWTLSLAALALALRFVPYSEDDGSLNLGWARRDLRLRPASRSRRRSTWSTCSRSSSSRASGSASCAARRRWSAARSPARTSCTTRSSARSRRASSTRSDRRDASSGAGWRAAARLDGRSIPGRLGHTAPLLKGDSGGVDSDRVQGRIQHPRTPRPRSQWSREPPPPRRRRRPDRDHDVGAAAGAGRHGRVQGDRRRERHLGPEQVAAIAAALAHDDQERLRSMDPRKLVSYSSGPQQKIVNRVPYTVESTSVWETDRGEADGCTRGSGRVSYVRVSSKVTWPVMGSSKPVTAASIIAISNAYGKGSLGVKLVDRTGSAGVPGVTVAADAPISGSKTTNDRGLRGLGRPERGRLHRRVRKTGLRGPERRHDRPASPTAGAWRSGRPACRRTPTTWPGPRPSPSTRRWAPQRHSRSSATGVTVQHSGIPGPPARVSGRRPSPPPASYTFGGLFPFTSAYSAYAGACDPPASSANVVSVDRAGRRRRDSTPSCACPPCGSGEARHPRTTQARA